LSAYAWASLAQLVSAKEMSSFVVSLHEA